MSVIGDFTISASAFALEDALTAVPQATLTAERMATHSAMEVLPFLWATGDGLAELTDALGRDSDVDQVTVAEEIDDARLYKIEWTDEFVELINDMVDHHASMIEARASGDTWRLKLRFVSQGQVTEFQRYFDEQGRNFEVHRLYRSGAPRQHEYDLTDEQFETLVTAAREGHFAVPRDATAEDLAETLGVSPNAVSQRLRRATGNLVTSTLLVDADRMNDE